MRETGIEITCDGHGCGKPAKSLLDDQNIDQIMVDTGFMHVSFKENIHLWLCPECYEKLRVACKAIESVVGQAVANHVPVREITGTALYYSINTGLMQKIMSGMKI